MSASVPQRPSDRKMAVLVLLSFLTVAGAATVVVVLLDDLSASTLGVGIGAAAVMSVWMWFRNHQLNRDHER